MSEVKRIDFVNKMIIGKSGKEYKIELDQIPVGRYSIYERMAMELGFGISFKDVFGSYAEIYKVLTEGDSAMKACHKGAMLCHGQMSKIKNRSDFKDEFIFCSLFCNSKDEDRSTWTIDLAEEKIKDWAEYHSDDFFLLSHSGIEGYAKGLAHLETLPLLLENQNGKVNPVNPTTKKARKQQ